MTTFRAVVVATAELALVAALLAACGDDGDSDSGDDPSPSADAAQVELTGHTFVADEVTGHELVEGSNLRVGFEDDGLSVSAGCNTLFGPYVEEDGVVRWEGEPAGTLMACEPALSEQDAWLTTLFTDGMTIEDSDDADLVLTSGDVRMELSRTDLGGGRPRPAPRPRWTSPRGSTGRSRPIRPRSWCSPSPMSAGAGTPTASRSRPRTPEPSHRATSPSGPGAARRCRSR